MFLFPHFAKHSSVAVGSLLEFSGKHSCLKPPSFPGDSDVRLSGVVWEVGYAAGGESELLRDGGLPGVRATVMSQSRARVSAFEAVVSGQVTYMPQ